MDKLYVLIGSYCNQNNYSLISSFYKKDLSVSNSEYERVLLKGFCSNHLNVHMISAPSVGKFPSSCRYIRTKGFKSSPLVTVVDYCTLFFLSHISKYIALKKQINYLFKENKDKNIVLIACEPHIPYMKACKYAKRKYKCKTSLIVPDLPENVKDKGLLLYRLIKNRKTLLSYEIGNKYFDSYLFFTNKMVSSFNVENKKYLVREGIVEHFNFDCSNKKSKNTICTYIGKTNEKNGISVICEAAKQLKEFEFHIYGNGDMDDILRETHIDNLFYHGFIAPQSIDDVLLDSDILLSPRYPREYTSVSFPSKILKYISFGKPIVTYKLPCYPKAFDNFLLYPGDQSVQSFIECIQKAKTIRIDYESLANQCSYLLYDNLVKDYLTILDDKKSI